MDFRSSTTRKTRSRRLAIREDGRVFLKFAASTLDPYRPLMAHLIVTRRCNLSCGYCFEYDKVSPPVPLSKLKERIDHLARLRTIFVTLTGGESLLQPDIVEVVAYVRERGMIPALNTNGFLLTEKRIRDLGRAGLFAMQISIDNVEPNETSKKSLKTLLPKLKLLAAHAAFRVRVNSVLGPDSADEALEVARTVVALGFDAKCSLVRDNKGAVMALNERTRQAYDDIVGLGRRAPSYLSEDFQLALARDGTVNWKCRSGARYFTICEDGLVHLCESSWGNPGTPLATYSETDIRRAFHATKSCAPKCAVAYAHQLSRMDSLRSQSGGRIAINKQCWMQSTAEAEEKLVSLAGLSAATRSS